MMSSFEKLCVISPTVSMSWQKCGKWRSHVYIASFLTFTVPHCHLFSVTRRGSFSEPDSKKLALFAVTNVLFKIYFKLNTLQLCSKLINVVERPGPSCATDQFQYFPVSDVVAYKYYVGRLKMFEDRYEEARYVANMMSHLYVVIY